MMTLLVGVSCNRGVGCPAAQAEQKRVNVNDHKKGMFDSKKAQKNRKSSVMPREVRVK